jgi:hypothetical protein
MHVNLPFARLVGGKCLLSKHAVFFSFLKERTTHFRFSRVAGGVADAVCQD